MEKKYWILLIAFIFSLSFLSLVIKDVQADTLPERSKGIYTIYEIINIDDYKDYAFFIKDWHQLTYHPSYSLINKSGSVIIEVSSHSYCKICGISITEFNESEFIENVSKDAYFENTTGLVCTDNYFNNFGNVVENHPLESAKVVSEIIKINETILEIKKNIVNYTYTDGTYEEKFFFDQNSFPTPSIGPPINNEEIPVIWFILIPLVALIIIISILLLRKRK